MTMQERLHPTPDQIEKAAGLLDRVPHSGYDWTSEQGQVFLTYAQALGDTGVPVTWLARKVDMSPKQLYAALDRFGSAQRKLTSRQAS